MLFPAGARVDSPAGLALVAQWSQAGHALGNHTYAHKSFGSAEVSLDEFTTDVLRADTLLNGFPGWTRRLRFPYLKEGDTAQKRDALRAWMAAHGYASGGVSIDTSDWYYDQRYAAWLTQHPGADVAPFRQAYLEHLWDRAEYYDGLAKQVLGRSPRHVLLLHATCLNATFLSDVIAMFRARGWSIISPLEAFEDPLYALPTTNLPAGESVVWALAKSAGVRDLRYPGEDDVYERAGLDARGL
jgi:peptidoglycan/xylan/chitin deacetylase (PgdA/CDA1 family)